MLEKKMQEQTSMTPAAPEISVNIDLDSDVSIAGPSTPLAHLQKQARTIPRALGLMGGRRSEQEESVGVERWAGLGYIGGPEAEQEGVLVPWEGVPGGAGERDEAREERMACNVDGGKAEDDVDVNIATPSTSTLSTSTAPHHQYHPPPPLPSLPQRTPPQDPPPRPLSPRSANANT
ncbi:hypothetical protein H0H92_007136, partial [Tricholoma furcatifolium]